MNDDYTDGIICPYEIPDQWQYEYDRQWYVGEKIFYGEHFQNEKTESEIVCPGLWTPP